MPSNQNHNSQMGVRVATIEADLKNLEGTVAKQGEVLDRIEGAVSRLGQNFGKPNWQVWGVALTIISMVGALAAAVVFGPILSLDKKGDDAEKRMDRITEKLERQIEREQDRNNRLEREIGGVTKINDLFVAGKLKLE